MDADTDATNAVCNDNLRCRQVGQDSKVERFRAAAKGLSAAIQANSAYVSSARNSLDCSPKDAARLAVFLASDTDQQQVRNHVHRCRCHAGTILPL